MIIKIFYTSFKITFLALIFFLSIDCNQNKIIEEEKFIEIYADIIIAKDTTSASSKSKDDVIKNVLAKYDVMLDEYKTTIQFYNQDSKRWEKFFAKAIASLEERKKKAAE